MRLSRRTLLGTGAAGAVAALAACGSGGTAATDEELDENADVTISVGGQPTEDKPEERKLFQTRLEAFQKENPHITVEPSTEKWDPQTFQAKLAGGTLPTVMTVALTYSHELIADGQLPDMSTYLEKLEMVDELNPLALENVKDDQGRIFTIPLGLYSVGLVLNRALFTQAGLDPDTPPTTWEEVRTAAKAIHDKVPGATGYAQLTSNNTGGWMLSALTYANGGLVEDEAGEKSVMGDATIAALEDLAAMRWEDDSMGSQFLYDQESLHKDFAAGKVGMMLMAPDAYKGLVVNYGFSPDDFGITALPQNGTQNGTLTGGSIKLFDVKATPNQLLAAAKWVKYYDFARFYDEERAVSDAKASAADGSPVGVPGLSPVSQEIYDRYMGWIAEYVNVPLDNFAGYTDSELPLVAEPATATQQVYAQLDTLIQKVLTEQGTDIAAEVEAANTAVDGIIAQAAR